MTKRQVENKQAENTETGNKGSNTAEAEIAVALGYDSALMDAPQVLATGRGHVANKMLEIARQNNIAVEKDPVLAEALGQLAPGQEIPPELYRVVAEILVFIMDTDRKTRTGLK